MSNVTYSQSNLPHTCHAFYIREDTVTIIRFELEPITIRLENYQILTHTTFLLPVKLSFLLLGSDSTCTYL